MVLVIPPLTYSAPNNTSWNLVTASGTIPSTSNLRIKFSKNSTDSWRLDDVKLIGVVANLPPTATSVSFSGNLIQGQVLTGSYTYSDTENDLEGTSTFKWYRSDDASGTNKTAISGATSLTYELTYQEVGKYISFEVTPVAQTGATTGTPVESSRLGEVETSNNMAPVASNVAISGTLTEGQVLSGTYTYSDSDNDLEGTSLYRWYRSDDLNYANKTVISGAVNQTYTLTVYDAGKYISFEVTPKAATGTLTGLAVESTLSGPVTALPNNAPVASLVTISGSLKVDSTLTGSYVYSDTENNPQGVSTFKWFAADDASGTNEIQINGAQSSTYQLLPGDFGKYISFEVTPVASVGTLVGTAVKSSRFGPITGTPTISVLGSLGSFGSISINTMSQEKNYTVLGNYLTDNVLVTAPTGFKITKTSGSGYSNSLTLIPNSGRIDSTAIYVVFAPTTGGSYSGNITHASTGAVTQNQAVSGTGSIGLPIYEDFDYANNSKLTDNGWVAHSGAGTNPISVGASNGLTYPGYVGSGIGNAVKVSNNGEDVSLMFTAEAADTIYFSFLLNTVSVKNGFFIHLGTSSTNFTARVYATVAGGGYQLGIGNNTTPSVWSDTLILNQTYLVIGKYRFSGQTATLWVFSSGVPASEAAAGPSVLTMSGSGQTSVDRICLRQFDAGQNFIVDGIRVAKSWNNAPLPVELTSFTVSPFGNGANLAWSTATETNNAGWHVERTNGNQWQTIGFVSGKGTTTAAQSYSFTDYNVTGKVQYRLKQVDNDGTYTYSNVLAVEVMPTSFEVLGNYPNPFNPSTMLRFTLPQTGKVRVVISNVLGQHVAVVADREFNKGMIELPFSAANLSSGVYYYTITANGKSVTKTMMLMK